MTFSAKTSVVGREAASILELDLDGCQRRYGVSPCTAFLALTNNNRQSETIDSASWAKGATTVTPNARANPLDGATTADDVFETAVTDLHRISQTSGLASIDVTVAQTVAVYVRPINGRDRLKLIIFNASDTANSFEVSFDLTNQTITNTNGNGDGSPIGGNIYPVGTDGFYRIVATGIPDTLGGVTDGINYQVRFIDSAGLQSYLGDVTKGFTIYGVSHRFGLKPGKYIATTTAGIDNNGAVDDLCFNTFGTCQDTANYLKEVRTYRFCDRVTRPIELIDAFPAIKSVSYSPTQLKPGGKFSVRGRVVVTLQDFAGTDSGIDNYQEERTFDQETRGTFFGKLKERNKFYIGRPMRVLEGYLDAPFSLTNFRTREYIIENITGPTADGRVTIEGKDILALARDDRAKCPIASTGTVAIALTDTGTSLTVSAGDGGQYNPTTVDKHIRISDEIMEVTAQVVDVLTVVRAQGGTTAKAHSIGGAIQACKTFEDEPVIDVINTLLTTFSNIPASFIPFTDWELEETESLAGYDLENIISTPTGVTKLLQEICEITLIDLWYSDVDQEIKLKLQTPFTVVTETWTDDDNVIMGSLRVRDLNSARLSRILIYYGRRNFAKDKTEPENYDLVNFEIEVDKEGVNKYDDEKIRTIFSSWFDSTNSVQVALTSGRLLKRFGITPIEVMFDIDAKDVETLQTGDVYDLQTRVIQDTDGSKKTTRFQITETKPKKVGSIYSYKSMAFFQDPTPTSLTISANDTNFDVFVELGGPPGPIDVTVTVNTGINVDALNGSAALFTTGMHPDSTLKIINNGNIRGYGGNGGRGGNMVVSSIFFGELGGCFFFGTGDNGLAGQAGGDAINTTLDITIDNTNGNIFAGAGAGGGGDSFRTGGIGRGGGGGGGGLGTDTGNGGPGGDVTEGTVDPACSVTLQDGSPGTAGTDTAAGAGGASGGPSAGAGGAGGADWGDDGFDGLLGGALGGVGGFAVRLNGNSIIFEGGNNPTQVKGDVA